MLRDTVRAYAELLRLPNVFTAMADIGLGALASWALDPVQYSWHVTLGVLASSCCLYMAGMAWNDYFDLEQDRRERAFRPLPSGRIAPPRAALIGTLLLTVGGLLAAATGWNANGFDREPAVLAVLLCFAILAYDAVLKRTWLGPLAMGLCRFLNVLLGLSMVSTEWLPWGLKLYLAGVVGMYIVGVTWFARTEARQSSRNALAGALVVMMLAALAALAVPVLVYRADSAWFFPYLLIGLGFYVAQPASQALLEPEPGPVQRTVKRAIQGLVVLDAALACAIAGPAGLGLLLLLVPAAFLGKWVYST